MLYSSSLNANYTINYLNKLCIIYPNNEEVNYSFKLTVMYTNTVVHVYSSQQLHTNMKIERANLQ